MKIEVLGPGCNRCNQLYDNVKTAISRFKGPETIEIEKIGDIHYFSKMGVFMTPGLVINGKTVSVGKVLSVEEIDAKIKENL
ncbi:MAG: thioredoxin family protein [Thermodesulfobacteriota bacterium]